MWSSPVGKIIPTEDGSSSHELFSKVEASRSYLDGYSAHVWPKKLSLQLKPTEPATEEQQNLEDRSFRFGQINSLLHPETNKKDSSGGWSQDPRHKIQPSEEPAPGGKQVFQKKGGKLQIYKCEQKGSVSILTEMQISSNPLCDRGLKQLNGCWSAERHAVCSGSAKSSKVD